MCVHVFSFVHCLCIFTFLVFNEKSYSKALERSNNNIMLRDVNDVKINPGFLQFDGRRRCSVVSRKIAC